ncbi:hypothetical protein Tco_0682852 [Tanacetum coccineum]|uniref:Uncharacterized protein n=1 Tax=Tanacetum coccineum TaxID=301880 RepID=A0ABQ4XTG6_9ASTR
MEVTTVGEGESSIHADTSSVVNEGGVIDDPLAQPATQTENLLGGSVCKTLASDVSHLHSAAPSAILRRWSGTTDTSIDLSSDKKEDQKDIPGSVITEVQDDQTNFTTQLTVSSSVKFEESVGSNDSNQLTSNLENTHSLTSLTKSDDNSLTVSQVNDFDGGQEEQVGKSDQVKFGSSTIGSLEQDTRLVKATDPGMMTLRAPPKKASLSSGSKIQEAFVSDVESDQTTRLAYRKQVADPIPEQQRMFESPIPVMDYQKRDARLRESWDSNGAEKEARMKAMNDSLERLVPK